MSEREFLILTTQQMSIINDALGRMMVAIVERWQPVKAQEAKDGKMPVLK